MSMETAAQQSVTEQETSAKRWEEHLTHDASDQVLAFAPHGGQMEPYTAEQAFQVAAAFTGCSAWAYCGYVDDGSARAEYYITSTEMVSSEYNFLPQLLGHGFELGVAFHGYSPDSPHPDVYIGGTAHTAVRERLAESIATHANIDVGVAQPSDGLLYQRYAGVRSENIVNRLGERGLQLEQTLAARRESRSEICRGVIETMRELGTDM